MRCYATQRPVAPGAIPMRTDIADIVNYDEKQYCEEINDDAWGYVDYCGELSQHEVDAYELVPAGAKAFWIVQTMITHDGRQRAMIVGKTMAAQKPLSRVNSYKTKDIYTDYFGDRAKALDVVQNINYPTNH